MIGVLTNPLHDGRFTCILNGKYLKRINSNAVVYATFIVCEGNSQKQPHDRQLHLIHATTLVYGYQLPYRLLHCTNCLIDIFTSKHYDSFNHRRHDRRPHCINSIIGVVNQLELPRRHIASNIAGIIPHPKPDRRLHNINSGNCVDTSPALWQRSSTDQQHDKVFTMLIAWQTSAPHQLYAMPVPTLTAHEAWEPTALQAPSEIRPDTRLHNINTIAGFYTWWRAILSLTMHLLPDLRLQLINQSAVFYTKWITWQDSSHH